VNFVTAPRLNTTYRAQEDLTGVEGPLESTPESIAQQAAHVAVAVAHLASLCGYDSTADIVSVASKAAIESDYIDTDPELLLKLARNVVDRSQRLLREIRIPQIKPRIENQSD
jgi:hypothetical protein